MKTNQPTNKVIFRQTPQASKKWRQSEIFKFIKIFQQIEYKLLEKKKLEYCFE